MCVLLRCVVLCGALLLGLPPPCLCFTHWVVTEDGKIEYQVASPFSLHQPYDLMAFTQQEKRVSLLKDLKQQLIDYKEEFEHYSGFDSFDASYRASHPECRNVKLISSYDLTVSTVLPLKYKGIDFLDHLVLMAIPPPAEPHCTLTPLDFSVWALEHLEGVQWRRGLVTPPEKTVLDGMNMRMEVFGSFVHQALQQNKTSWVLFNLASLYWRARGNAHHAIECIRRALHYSPHHAMDVALLNLANVLHRSHHSSDALVALRMAAELSPSASVLHFTMGNVHASLKDLNNSALCYKRCMGLDNLGGVCQEVYLSTMCEHRMEQASREHSDKLGETQRKLDLFYSNMDQVKKQRATCTTPTPAEWEDIPGKKAELAGPAERVKITANDDCLKDGNSDDVGLVDATLVSDLEMELGGTKKDVESSTYEGYLDLEEALEQALNNETDSGTKKGHHHSGNKSGRGDRVMHPEQASSTVILKLSPDDQVHNIDTQMPGAGNLATGSVKGGYCLDEVRSLFMQMSPNMNYKKLETNLFPGSVNEVSTLGTEPHDCFSAPSRLQHRDEVLMLELIEQDDPSPFERTAEDSAKVTPGREYPKDYHSLEFHPYHSLPDYLETLLFPSQATPLPAHHDPYWPRKKECVEMVGELKGSRGLAGYASTFLAPEARGLSIKELLASVPEDLPYEMRREPRCTKIVELPLSMAAMDHLEPMLNRANFKPNIEIGEKGLRKAVVTSVKISLDDNFSLEESGERVFAAMTQHGPNWLLFDLASLYWRARGDPMQSIECLRRAVHFAPRKNRDIGYVGLANVLFHQGYLNEAVIMARAALDISRCSPVAHYTLAHIYLGLRAYEAANLHLRAALQVQPEFDHALSTLRMVRCSLKFKEEQIFLRQKMREAERAALRKQEAEIRDTLEEVVKNGEVETRIQPVLVVENIEPPEIPELSMGEMMESPFTGDDAVRYLVRLSLGNQKRKGRNGGGGNGGEGLQDKVILTVSTDGDDGADEKDVLAAEKTSPVLPAEQTNPVFPDDVADKKKTITPFTTAPEDGVEGGVEGSGKKKKKRRRRTRRKSKPSAGTPTLEEIRRVNLEELERETNEIIKEAAEILNRNQTPVVRRTPAKVYRVPGGGLPRPSKVGKVTLKDGKRTSKGTSKDSKVLSKHKPLPTLTPAAPAKRSSGTESSRTDLPGIELEDRVMPPAPDTISAPTLLIEEGSPSKVKTPPTACEKGVPTKMQDCLIADKANEPSSATKEEVAPTNTVGTGGIAHGKEMGTASHSVWKEQVCEDEMRQGLPGVQPWPTLEKCEEKPLSKGIVFTSTWLSVTAKGVKVEDHIDCNTVVRDNYALLPYCHNDFEPSEKTLSHLAGMNDQPLIQYEAEKGLQEVLCMFNGKKRSLDEMATRIKLAMVGNSSSWVLSNLAALYWRVVGQGQLAVKCLKHALYYSDDSARDVALVSLTNVLYRCGYDLDAAKVIQMSLEFSPTLVVNHFTMANILAAQGSFVEAAEFYKSTLQYQPEFQPAAQRLRIVRCLMLMAKKNLQQRPAMDRT